MGKLFRNDYSEGAQKDILDAVINVSKEQNIGYGLDKHSINAKKIILKKCQLKNGNVFFVSGGTQANMLVLSYLLKPYEAVISSNIGHINVHETGAVEGSGHKIITITTNDGKLNSKDILNKFIEFSDEHMVKLKAVYISDSTELGYIYTKKELLDIYNICAKLGLYLFIDGARLGCALTSKKNDVTLEFLSSIADVFYIGGTKNGFLSGECIVFKDAKLCSEFRYHIKNRGAMLAKGFVIGAQYERAFQDNLYFDLAKHSNEMSEYIYKNLKNKVKFIAPCVTNQLFLVLKKDAANMVNKEFGCEYWGENKDGTIIRIVTSFATEKCDADKLIDFIKNLI